MHQKAHFLKRITIIPFLFFTPLISGFAEENPQKNKNQTETVKQDSLRVADLCRQTAYYNQVVNDDHLTDSVAELAIEIATGTFSPGLILAAYDSYLDHTNLNVNYNKALNYALAAEQLSRTATNQSRNWKSVLNLSKVYLAGYEFDKALISAYKSLTLADELNDDKKKIESYLMIGRSLESSNQKIEAFRNYLVATKHAKLEEDQQLLLSCYAHLSDFYLNNNLYQKAAAYKLMEEELVSGKQPVDSLALMWIKYDLQVINLNSDDTRIHQESMEEILDFAHRNNQQKLKEYEFAVYRSMLTKLNRIDLLRQLYTEKYPAEFQKLHRDSPSFYYRLKAYFSEEESNYDSAGYYFSKANDLLRDNSNKIMRSNFLIRYGQFLDRSGNYKRAIVHLKEAYQLAEEAGYMVFMLNASHELEKLFANEANFEQAYHYANLNTQLNDSINKMAERDKLLMLEINYEAQQQALAEERERQETLRRHNLQYTAIVIGILTVFVILILLGSFKVPKWIIQALGFVSFIFLFEFIILLADQKIHHMTHGEPWKILAIKIVLIGILLPLHHWIEHKVVQRLISKKLIDFSSFSVLDIFRKSKA
ncbi:MAG: hypothetical protein KQH67_05645 [Bacteroidetes bacterium]|nr:hypothetical protein [Bacteroidota bacterium]